MLVCKNCGSTNVQTLAWVDVNTNEYHCDGPGDMYCEDCNSDTKVREETPEEKMSRIEATKYLDSINSKLKF